MENSPQKRKKVKDIFSPHELKSNFFSEEIEENEEPEIQEENEISLSMKEESIMITRMETSPETQEEIKKIREEKQSEEPMIIDSSSQEKKKKGLRMFMYFMIPVTLAFLYYLGFIGLARAEILISSRKMEIPFSKEILVDTNVSSIDTTKAIIPGNLFSFNSTETEEFTSTGQGKDEKKAKGIITIYNNYSTSPQILVATTRFETPDHKIFRLDSRTVVPGATTENGKLVPSTIDVKVTADQPGADYNIEACNLPDCKFSIPGFKGMPEFDGFYGVSKNAMAGGSSGSVPVVSSEDIKNAESVILDKVINSINQDLENKVPQGLTILTGAKSGVNISKLSSNAELGDYVDKFTVEAEMTVKVIAFDENNIIKYVQGVLEEDRDENYNFCKDLEIEYSDLETDFDKGTLNVTIKVNQTLCHQLDLDEIKSSVIGKNQEELDEIFKNNPGIDEVQIKFWPFWIKKVPNSLQKINILIDADSEEEANID